MEIHWKLVITDRKTTGRVFISYTTVMHIYKPYPDRTEAGNQSISLATRSSDVVFSSRTKRTAIITKQESSYFSVFPQLSIENILPSRSMTCLDRSRSSDHITVETTIELVLFQASARKFLAKENPPDIKFGAV
ncbi:hypothetical protein AVEN_137179-1 [Araneus ventricosus]|uniref:Uncharacterized protein n=1 Tax=Araneus ventricosus TaxID=182803 RepID=A0A4Y2MXY5_ARAVE|nr:hypothetical protein AVEN_137179-1 [Araneus ventricosus]